MDTHLLFSIGTAAAGLAILGLVLFAVSRVVGDRRLDPAGKVCWVIGIVVFPLVGAGAWFVWNGCGRPGLGARR
jgi:hypothetical protein